MIASLFLITATLAPSVLGSIDWYGGNYWDNFRTNERYSTWDINKALHENAGMKFNISPKDSFDFIPAKGYGQFKTAGKALANPDSFESMKVLTGYDAVAEWARAELNTHKITKHEVPMPNESLVGKDLTAESISEVIPVSEYITCHAIEQETYFCHKTSHIRVSAVTVSPNDKPSTLWVACHVMRDDGSSRCHVMNVGDIIVSHASATSTDLPFALENQKSFLRKND